MNTISESTQKLRQSAFFKIFTVGFLIILLLIPLALVDSLIYERQERYDSVIYEIGKLWGESQNITGPLLSVPYQRLWEDDKGKIHTDIHYAYFLPENLTITGDIIPETRYRGIFEVVVYRVNLAISGNFSPPTFKYWSIDPNSILWEESVLSIGISDTRGIREALTMNWNDQAIEFFSGSHSKLLSNGLHLRLPQLKDATATEYHFDFQVSLNGHQRLSFSPVGKKTVVTLNSTWSDPSFSGAFLPVERAITPQGFEARWQVSHLGRSFPQFWNSQENNYVNFKSDYFNVNLLLPVDFYQKVERSVKYGLLFILLTFTTFFLFEVFNPIRIHPLQYLMVGAALCIFYLLLLSISEHVNFTVAYLIASIATIVLITGYGQRILVSTQRALIMGVALAVLYLYLYTLLHLQDYALLFGSLGLFCILALVMYITRNVDWYNISLTQEKDNQ